MQTNWKLIREVMNGVIDACEAVEELDPDLHAGDYEARSEYQDDVCVGDFMNRFWQYPEGAARDIMRLRSAMQADQKHPSELARALVQAAAACAEAIDLPEDKLSQEHTDFAAHCGSGGHSVESLLRAIPEIQNGWMLTGVTKALEQHRNNQQAGA